MPIETRPLESKSASDVLRRIEERLARIEARTAWIDEAQTAVPRVLATAGDMLDEVAAERDLYGRMNAAMHLLDRLTREETLQQLGELLDLAESLKLVQSFPKIVATAGDTIDAYADLAEASGVELDTLVPKVGRLSTQIVKAVQVAEKAPPAPKGVLALLRELKDPDVRQAIGFALALAREIGRANQETRSE